LCIIVPKLYTIDLMIRRVVKAKDLASRVGESRYLNFNEAHLGEI